MMYLHIPKHPQEVRAMALSYNERDHPFFKEYMRIRDHHYFTKNNWEPCCGEDKYDPHSVYILITVNGHVAVGCRMITDKIGLPVREVLKEHGLPTDQVPAGSYELSRFASDPAILHSPERTVAEFLRYFAQALTIYCKMQKIEQPYGVLISVLEKWFGNIGIQIEHLSYPATTKHGDSVFNTVRFVAEGSDPFRSTDRHSVQNGDKPALPEQVDYKMIGSFVVC